MFRENYFLSRTILKRFIDARRFNSYYLQEARFADLKPRADRVRDFYVATIRKAPRGL